MEPSVEAPVALYDESTNERPRNVFLEHVTRPFKRAVDIVRNRVDDLRVAMNSPAFLDQYPANSVPYVFSKLYSFGLTTPQRRGVFGGAPGDGWVNLAPVVDPGAFIVPRNGNIFVNREGSFYLCEMNANGYVSFTWASDPGAGANPDESPPFDFTAPPVQFGGATAGDIFDSVIDNNGGAVALDYFYSIPKGPSEIDPGPPPVLKAFGDAMRRPHICFDLELYDRKRQRLLHDEKLPPQLFTAQNFANKNAASPIRFDVNTEVEPRVRILEMRMADLLDTDQAYNAAVVRGYLNLTFFGYKVLAV
jgi:hypothetical protein